MMLSVAPFVRSNLFFAGVAATALLVAFALRKKLDRRFFFTASASRSASSSLQLAEWTREEELDGSSVALLEEAKSAGPAPPLHMPLTLDA
jgi:hypothetical protein